MLIKIRFNTDTLKFPDQGLSEWRILYGGNQYFARHVHLDVPSWSTQDEVEPGVIKFHLTCEGEAEWNESKDVVKIRPVSAT